jgi:hypothetical protein
LINVVFWGNIDFKIFESMQIDATSNTNVVRFTGDRYYDMLSQELRPSFESGKALARIAGRLPYWIIFIIVPASFARRPKIYPALAKRQCKGSLKTEVNDM